MGNTIATAPISRVQTLYATLFLPLHPAPLSSPLCDKRNCSSMSRNVLLIATPINTSTGKRKINKLKENNYFSNPYFLVPNEINSSQPIGSLLLLYQTFFWVQQMFLVQSVLVFNFFSFLGSFRYKNLL